MRMLNATKRELVKDFQSALEFDQSAMFRKIYEEEFGTFGGAPYGALIGDFEISRQPEDMYFIEQMSHVAAAAHAPFITASPELFGLESYGDLASRAIWPRYSTRWNTPSGRPSANRRMPATWA
jgi:type VI secretion system protein ImpC